MIQYPTMKKPLISVVIPAYNEENYIEVCLESVLAQDFPKNDYEVIVVDNNSTDNTASLVKKRFPQVRLVNEKKQGVVFARIKGVAEAKGEIIAFIDADSIAPKNWLAKINKGYADKRTVAVGGTLIYEPKKGFIAQTERVINFFYHLSKIPPGTNFSFKKEAYQKIGGFSQKINMNEDLYLALTLKKIGKIIILKDNPVITSSRRLLSPHFSWFAYRSLLNTLSIYFFGKSIFFNFEAIRNNSPSVKKIINTLKGLDKQNWPFFKDNNYH